MTIMESIPYQELEIGATATYEKSLTEEDLVLFATTSGDVNPVHLDEAYAADSMFKGRIAHGMWSAGLISAALATVMPGPGSIYLGQSLNFRRPVRLGDRLTVTLKVKEKRDDKQIVTIDCKVKNQDGRLVVDGEASVIAPKERVRVERPQLPEITIG
ncbi:MAG: MaoC/PaaZ C-terminal domain-containing protein [Candidatus Sedimenticola sp. (ex Thyasira tokunagai)]